MKPVKVHEVKSYKDFPTDEDGTPQASYVKAVAYPSTREIFVVKGKTTEASKQHEIGHVVLRHGDGYPRNPEMYVKQELDATLYAYKKIGEPKHIRGRLRGWFNEVYARHYKIPHHQAWRIIENQLRRSNVPSEWQQDFVKADEEYNRVFRKGK